MGSQSRQQIAMIDLTKRSATSWFTDRYPNGVAGSGQGVQVWAALRPQMRDVEFSPDGSYFVVVTTGALPTGT